MTVAELIKKLQKQPQNLRVCLVYDSAVMVVDVERVAAWDANRDRVVGLFDQSSTWEIPKSG